MNESIEQILGHEFSRDFVQGMKDRMVMSYYKYGAVKDGFPSKVNALECLEERIKKYHATGNTEWLMDAANYCMIEFMFPAHPKAHFRATDSNESKGRAAIDQDFNFTSSANDQLTDDQWKELQKFRRESGQ